MRSNQWMRLAMAFGIFAILMMAGCAALGPGMDVNTGQEFILPDGSHVWAITDTHVIAAPGFTSYTVTLKSNGALVDVNDAFTTTKPLAPVVAAGSSGGSVVTGMSITELQKVWVEAKKTPADPGPFILALNEAWEIADSSMKGGSKVRNWQVPSGSIVWTDLLWREVKLTNGQKTPADKWVPLMVQGSWGVYYAYDDVVLPTPGRFLRTDRFLDPAKDLAGWVK